jgi:hypothetical protein
MSQENVELVLDGYRRFNAGAPRASKQPDRRYRR